MRPQGGKGRQARARFRSAAASRAQAAGAITARRGHRGATAGCEPRPDPRGSASQDGLGGFPRLVWRAEGLTWRGRPSNTWPRGSAPGGRCDRDREDQPAGVSRAICSQVSASVPDTTHAPAAGRTHAQAHGGWNKW